MVNCVMIMRKGYVIRSGSEPTLSFLKRWRRSVVSDQPEPALIAPESVEATREQASGHAGTPAVRPGAADPGDGLTRSTVPIGTTRPGTTVAPPRTDERVTDPMLRDSSTAPRVEARPSISSTLPTLPEIADDVELPETSPSTSKRPFPIGSPSPSDAGESRSKGDARNRPRRQPQPIGPAVAAAYRLFEKDDPEGATAILDQAALAAPLQAAGRELLDVLLPSNTSLLIIDAVLAHNDGDLTLLERSHWLARRFDSTAPDAMIQREAALDLLAAATMAGEAGWALVQEPERRARLDAALSEPGAQIDLLEQESFAPAETGLPATVPGRALAFGRLMAARGEFSAVRDAERLLHVLREPQLAYLLENDRKRWGAGFRNELTAPQVIPMPNGRLTIVLAGGHPPLRRLARHELDEMDLADVREFPSAWEGNRQGRHARDTVEGSDLAVVIWRQIAHSTSDQITSAARSLAVPVVRADTPTISAIRRAVTDFQESTTRRGMPTRP